MAADLASDVPGLHALGEPARCTAVRPVGILESTRLATATFIKLSLVH